MERLTALALAGAAVVAPRIALAQATDVIRVGVGPFEANAGAYYAQDSGAFKRAGLNVDIGQFRGGSAILAAIAGGALDVGIGNPLPLGNAHEHGLTFKYIAPGYLYDAANPPGTLLVVAANSPIRSAKDLDGKSIAGTAVPSIDTIAASAWMDANGGSASTVKFVEVGQPAMAEAVASGRIDAAVLSEPALGVALTAGTVRGLARCYDAFGPRVLVSGWFATEAWASSHADAVHRFRTAINEGATWAVKNPEQAALVLQKYLKLTIPLAHEYHARTLDPRFIQPVFDGAARYKILSRPLDAREIIWKG
jgi:NitT/TauT family transport system substrate-binding protein